MVFSKSYCPYCKSAKALLEKSGAVYKAIELDEECKLYCSLWQHSTEANSTPADGSDIQNALETISGQRTVPNIYIKQKHIGGSSDLNALGGKLGGLLKDAGALKA